MKRNELFEPGRYSSLPDVILRDPTLAASAKLVWMALAAHLGPNGTDVWPSMTRLSQWTGLSRDTVLRAIAALESAKLIVVLRQSLGKPNLYRILQPQVGQIDEKTDAESGENPSKEPTEKQSQNATSSKMLPVAECHSTGSKMLPEVVAKCDSKYCICTERSTPPTPNGEKAESGGNGFSPKTTKKQIVQQIDIAHGTAFGKKLPAKWKADIRREFDDGDRAALERIDAEVLRGAEKYRAAKRWSCLGHGTVMQYLADLDRTVNAARKKIAQTQAQAAEQAEKTELEQAKMDHYLNLEWQDRERYRDQVCRQFPHMKAPDIIHRQAAHAAWLDYEKTTIEVMG